MKMRRRMMKKILTRETATMIKRRDRISNSVRLMAMIRMAKVADLLKHKTLAILRGSAYVKKPVVECVK